MEEESGVVACSVRDLCFLLPYESKEQEDEQQRQVESDTNRDLSVPHQAAHMGQRMLQQPGQMWGCCCKTVIFSCYAMAHWSVVDGLRVCYRNWGNVYL